MQLILSNLALALAIGGFVGLKAPGLDELGQPGTSGWVVLDYQHALADKRLRISFVRHWLAQGSHSYTSCVSIT